MSTARVYDSKTEFSFCKDIGLWCLDLPRSKTCRYRTKFCKKTCYNGRIEKQYSNNLPAKDRRNLAFWENLTLADFVDFVSRKAKSKYPVKRFRFCTRGEIAYSDESLCKVFTIAKAFPDILFWIPTRAWRTDNPDIRHWLKALQGLDNVRLMASIDPSNFTEKGPVEPCKEKSPWSTIFYGDNSKRPFFVRCPKTWEKKKGHCRVCRKGCFSKKRVHVHLKTH